MRAARIRQRLVPAASSSGPDPRQSISAGRSASAFVVTAFRRLLEETGIGMTELSRRSEGVYRGAGNYVIPHNLMHLIEAHGSMPHLHQVIAISAITGRSLPDCLSVFGVDLRGLWTLQAQLHEGRTVLIPDAPYASEIDIQGWPSDSESRETTRLSSLTGRHFLPRTALAHRPPAFRYCRMGRDDADAMPLLAPGSIVRVDVTRRVPETRVGGVAIAATPIYLVDLGTCLVCRHVVRLDSHSVLLVAPSRTCEPIECRVPSEGTIVGQIDIELRSVTRGRPLPGQRIGGAVKMGRPLSLGGARQPVGATLHAARRRLGMQLRDLHQATEAVASTCGSGRYAIAIGSLSGLEAGDRLPRQIEKVFSLACVYNMDFFELMDLTDVKYDRAALSRWSHADDGGAPPVGENAGVLPRSVPEYLNPYLDVAPIAPRDVYLVGSSMRVFHPVLERAVALVVSANRVENARDRDAGRSLHLLQTRSGHFLCGAYVRRRHTTTLIPEASMAVPSFSVSNCDLDELGIVTTVLRRL